MYLPISPSSSNPAPLLPRSSRRRFLQVCGIGGGLGLAVSQLRTLLAREPHQPALVVREQKPFNAEPDLSDLVANWVTPTRLFFVRNHGNVPQLDASQFQLRIEGLVESPLTLTLDELSKKFTATSVTATLTCAGNRRVEFGDPRIKGVPWQAGAIGNAEWAGVKLAEVLQSLRLKPEAKHVWFEGADQVKHKDEMISFGGSVPLERVMSVSDKRVGVLLATNMNGEPLSPDHGAPLRAVTPGFIGARSVKWLQRIVVSDRPSPNHFLAHAYKVVPEDTLAAQDNAEPIYEYVINSAIAKVNHNGKVRVQGYAIPSGKSAARIRIVELSTDNGQTWHSAQLDKQAADFCWQLWTAELPQAPAGTRLLVRATDSTDATQPRVTPFNAKGYQYNGWHGVAM